MSPALVDARDGVEHNPSEKGTLGRISREDGELTYPRRSELQWILGRGFSSPHSSSAGLIAVDIYGRTLACWAR